MSDVKWIKLSTDMFEDEKIRLIENMPESDTILIIWVKLLAQAGKTNASGYIHLNENIPYTDEMLATIFNRPISTVRMALETFKSFGMIDIDENSFIHISNWEEHQNVEGMEKIREQTRKRVAKHREKGKTNNVTLHETLPNAPEVEGELEVEGEKDKDYTAKIKDLLPFFSPVNNFNELNKKYWDVIRETRKTGKVSKSVIYKTMKKWEKYDPVVIEYALRSHIDIHAGKKEEYTIGIMRNTSREEAQDQLNGKNKKSNVVPMKNREPEYDDYDYGF